MIDKVLVTRKINLISKDFEALEPLANLSLEAYQTDTTNEVLAERYLERMIGRMIDINYHLITEEGNPPPPDYFQSFIELGKMKILPPEFAHRIAGCAGLRNRLVHEYDEIDARKVYEGLKAAVRDIPEYLNYVNEFVKQK